MGNTIAANCCTKYQLKDKDGEEQYLKAKVVIRKYIDEESRMVLVWRAHNESDAGPTDVYVDETGWSVVQPIASSCGYSDAGSIVRTCVHLVQRHRTTASVLDLAAHQHPSVGALTDLVVTSNEDDMLGLAMAVENILLDEATASSSSSSSSITTLSTL